MTEDATQMVKNIQNDLAYLSRYIQMRLNTYFQGTKVDADFIASLKGQGKIFFSANLTSFIKQNNSTNAENLLLLIALAPHIQAQFFDQIIHESIPEAGDFPQIGGVRGKEFRGFLPTGETALFLLAGEDFKKRVEVQKLFHADHFFAKNHILWLEDVPTGEPQMSGKIILAQEYVELFTIGEISPPRFSTRFPAKRVETNLEWQDLVLHSDTQEQIKELETWINHHETLLINWEMQHKLKPGFRVLFHGPPGTGKTLTAGLLGKYTGKKVYKIDLSMVVSKFIGETEKNLANLFSKAENKDWILFFDEADALFGKRTNVRDAQDKYANQEVAYLLQRVENYAGLVILASNFKNNMDEAFIRRFQSIIHFPLPKASERLLLWQKGFPKQVTLAPEVSLSMIAKKYELSGAEIMNVVQSCCLEALGQGHSTITNHLISKGIKKEYNKEGKIMR